MTGIELAREYTQLNFTSGELKGVVNMRFFDIPPFRYTRIARIISPYLVSTRIITFGDGWFIGINPEGKFIRMDLQTGNLLKRSVVLSQGWVQRTARRRSESTLTAIRAQYACRAKTRVAGRAVFRKTV